MLLCHSLTNISLRFQNLVALPLPAQSSCFCVSKSLTYVVVITCICYDPMPSCWPVSKPDNLFKSQLSSFETGHAVHACQILVWPARPNFSAARSRKKLGLDVLVEWCRRIKQKHYTKVTSVMLKLPYFVFPVSVHGISQICTLS